MVERRLAYNRFRYYDPEEGRYISQDPIGLASGEFGFYNYVHNTNAWIDVFGLDGITIAELLKDEPELLQNFRDEFKNNPQWQGIDPDKTKIQYVDKATVDDIRKKKGESGGHHPHGLALDGPEGQKLTITNETRKIKNPLHSLATKMQRQLIKRLKSTGYNKK
ncbi:RHS repeat-associated core domain-containing protein [Flavobacterium sp. EDS]|uniref:RHS repeat domain-containing protein n=1 Tax=Flavobacterium sp. EDS TaxID=2897328 RepID=UPI00322205DB